MSHWLSRPVFLAVLPSRATPRKLRLEPAGPDVHALVPEAAEPAARWPRRPPAMEFDISTYLQLPNYRLFCRLLVDSI